MNKKIYTALFLTALSFHSAVYANSPASDGNTQNTITKPAPKPITLKNSRSFGEEWNLSLNNEFLLMTGVRFQKAFNKGHSRIGLGYHTFLPAVNSAGILTLSYDEALNSKQTRNGGTRTLFATAKVQQFFDYNDNDSVIAGTNPFPTLGIGYSWLKSSGLNTQVTIGGSAIKKNSTNIMFEDFNFLLIPYVQVSVGFGKIE